MPATRSARSPVSTTPGTRGQQPVGQPVAQGGHPGDVVVAAGHGGGQGGRRAHGAGHVGRAAAAPPLLAPAVDAGPDPGARADHQGAAPLRATELVAADRHQARAGRVTSADVEPRHGLDGVGVEDRPGRPSATIRATSSRGWTVRSRC